MEPEDCIVGCGPVYNFPETPLPDDPKLFCGVYELQIENTGTKIFTATDEDVILHTDDQYKSFTSLEYPVVCIPETQLPSPVQENLFSGPKGLPDLSEIENSGPDQIMIFTPTEDLMQPGLLESSEIICSKNELNTYLKILNENDDIIVTKPKTSYVKKIKAAPKNISESLKRKRELNRVASANCKRRKVENILKLQGTVQAIENSNFEIENMIETLKREVYDLEFELSQHINDKLCPIEFLGNKIVMK